MIVKALIEYLRSNETITGRPSTAFRTAQRVGTHSVTDREEARRLLRTKVANEIYPAHRPRDGAWMAAVTVRLIAQDADHEIGGGSELATATVEVNCWAKGADAQNRADVAGRLVQLCLEGFGAAYWGEDITNAASSRVSVADCELVRTTDFDERPTAGERWVFRRTMDFRVHYHQPSAVV